jgi:ParB-like chromosome segregation protein Spo0J
VKYHPASNLFPLMEGPDYTALVEDIRSNGLLMGIWLHPDGSILDGRNRYRACLDAGVDPEYRTWDGSGTATGFVLSLNLHRRQLTTSQRAMIAARLTNLSKGRPPLNKSVDSFNPVTIDDAATALDVSRASIIRANRVLEQAPDLVADIDAGNLSVRKAAATVPETPLTEPRQEKEKKEEPAIDRTRAIHRIYKGSADHQTASENFVHMGLGGVKVIEEAVPAELDLTDILPLLNELHIRIGRVRRTWKDAAT